MRAIRRLSHPASGAAVLLLALGCLPVCAAQIETELSQYSLSTDDVLTLSVTVTMEAGDESTEPELGQTGDFEVLGPPRSETGYSFVNMRGSKYVRRIWALRPLRSGSLTVPVASARVGGQTLRSEASSVEVTQGASGASGQSGGQPPSASAPAPGPGGTPFSGDPTFAIVARAEKKTAYVNEQITVEFDYYTSYRLPRRPGEQAPKAEGFVAETLPDPDPQYVTVSGRDYMRFTRRWALFATSPGKYKVTSAEEEIMIPPMYGTQSFVSNPLVLEVKPLPPPPRGAKFSGAVGMFTVQVAGAKTEVKAGEGLTVRAIVDGVGNLQAVPAPDLGAPEWCKVYQSGENRTSGPRNLGGRVVLGGKAEFEFLVVPRREGELLLKGASLLYFNPRTARYETARSAPLRVHVSHGEVIDDPGLRLEDAALNHIHTEHPRLHARRPLARTAFPTVLAGACLLAVLVAGGIRLQRLRRLSDPDRVRASGSARVALQAIARAEKAQPAAQCEAISEAVAQYVSDRLCLPAAVMGADDVAQQLAARGFAPQIAEAARDLLLACYAGRYAPGGDAPQALSQRAKALIRMVEEGAQ